jgi:DNA-directed RNA polymerase subunit alpha
MSLFLNCIETSTDSEKNISSSFVIEPLEAGQGITLGNSLRRTLLSDISGFAITGARINNLKNEFALIEGIREDVLEILLNLKEIIFKPSLILKEKNSHLTRKTLLKFKAFLNVQGPLIVTAGMFFLPKDSFQILNPEQYICTIVDDSNFYLEIDIENGIGYQLIDEYRKKKIQEKLLILKPTTLPVDSIFTPVKKVNFKIKLIHDSYGHIKESLLLEIITNGSLTPKRSFLEAVKILIHLLYPLLLSPQLAILLNKRKKLEFVSKNKKENKKEVKKEVKKEIQNQGNNFENLKEQAIQKSKKTSDQKISKKNKKKSEKPI